MRPVYAPYVQDLIAFSRGKPAGGNKKEFFFDDYLDAMEGALEVCMCMHA